MGQLGEVDWILDGVRMNRRGKVAIVNRSSSYTKMLGLISDLWEYGAFIFLLNFLYCTYTAFVIIKMCFKL